MPKRVITFKPTPECEVQMAELMDRWGCDRTTALIRAVEIAYQGTSELMEAMQPKPADVTSGPASLKAVTSNTRPDPDKIAAAQRQFGMGGVKSRG